MREERGTVCVFVHLPRLRSVSWRLCALSDLSDRSDLSDLADSFLARLAPLSSPARCATSLDNSWKRLRGSLDTFTVETQQPNNQSHERPPTRQPITRKASNQTTNHAKELGPNNQSHGRSQTRHQLTAGSLESGTVEQSENRQEPG